MKSLVLIAFLALEVHSIKRDECGVSHIHGYGNRIAGGREALSGEFPWMVSLQEWHHSDDKFNHFCGGTILNKHWILTAAHCLIGLDPQSVHVVVGANHIPTNKGHHYGVETLISHDDFNRAYGKYDIALVRIDGEFNFKASDGKINNICLPDEDSDLFDGVVTATGWGQMEHYGPLSKKLMAVDLPVDPLYYCRTRYPAQIFRNTVFCAGKDSYSKDTCAGDSGGPAIQMNIDRAIIVGITSHGKACATPGSPGVYTKVSKFITWIYEQMDQNI